MQMWSFTHNVRQGSRIHGASRWWLILLGSAAVALALWGFAGRVQGAAEKAPAPQQAAAAIAVRTAPAVRGPVAASLAYTGDVKAVSQINVLPKASGRIERLPVEVGTRVKKGDVLAELEAGTMKAQLSQAKANLVAAEAKLSGMEAGSRKEQVAQAKANLDSATARLAGMSGGRGEQIAQAQAALEITWANRERVKKGATSADRQAAEGGVQSAQANLQTATARLESLKSWPTQTEWGQALGAVDSARANLVAAQIRFNDAREGPKEDVLKAAEAAVVSAQAQMTAIDDLRNLFDNKDSSANAAAAAAAAGATSGERINRQAAAAQAQLEAAEARLELLRRSPLPADLQQLQAAVDAANAGVLAAEYRVDQMKRGATREDLQQAEAGISAAEAALASAQARLKQIDEGATEEDLWVVDSAVKQAEQAVAMAQRPFREEDVAQSRHAVAAAQAAYDLALDPFTRSDIDLVRAGVAQARAAVEMSEIALAEVVVLSPMDGVVAERFQSVGALIGPTAPIVSLISMEVEIVLGVEESQIGQVREGQKAEISVAAHPGVLFPAKVALIAPVADPRSRTFQVKVRPEESDGKLKPGMFAQVRIVTEEREQALLVPKEAVVTRAGQTALFVLKGESVQMRQVTLGLRHNGRVEVVSGLEAGEEVVVSGQNELRDGDRVRKA